MKKISITLIVLAAIFFAWILVSPLFINTTVEEEVPINFKEEVLQEKTQELSEVQIHSGAADSSEEAAIMPVVGEKKNKNINPSNKLVGSFKGADSFHRAGGEVYVLRDEDKSLLRFENFSVTNGPDLFVTLNKGDSSEGEHIVLEELKGNKGDQNYDISGYNIGDYQSVSIYCQAFSVEFASAQLEYNHD